MSLTQGAVLAGFPGGLRLGGGRPLPGIDLGSPNGRESLQPMGRTKGGEGEEKGQIDAQSGPEVLYPGAACLLFGCAVTIASHAATEPRNMTFVCAPSRLVSASSCPFEAG